MTHFLRYSLVIFLSVFCISAFAQTDNSIREVYKTKKKDTVEGICQMYGITINELIDANPEMQKPKFRMKKNLKLNIPYAKVEEDFAATKKETQPVRIMKTYPGQTVKVGVMLPFKDKTDGKRMVEYYRGFLIACDSLRHNGQNIDIQTWDITSTTNCDSLLEKDNADNCDIIFAQPTADTEKQVSDFCSRNKIKLVIPFNIKNTTPTTSPFTYQVYESWQLQNANAINLFMGLFPQAQPIIVKCDGENERKQAFVDELKKRFTGGGLKYRTCDLGCNDDIFAGLFSPTQTNVIVLTNVNSEQTFKSLFAKLEAVKEAKPNVKIAVYGYVDFLIYENSFRARYHKFNTYVPTVFYYNNSQSRVKSFETKYKEWFKTELMNSYLPRLGFTGYDHAAFFLKGMDKMGSDFDGKTGQVDYEPMQTPLRFVQNSEGDIFQNKAFQVVHYDTDNSIEILSE